jgi:hypothetical protein
MRWKVSLVVLVAASVMLAVAASAAPLKKKHKLPNHWHAGYGYLPGFSPAERRARAFARWRDERRGPYYIYGGPGYWSSFSRPGFYNNRWNGGGIGPCWTRTPIGPIWNCG